MAPADIEIKLYASLRKYDRGTCRNMEKGGLRKVGDVARELGVPEKEIAIVIVNGERGRLETRLQGGDLLQLFPLIGGG